MRKSVLSTIALLAFGQGVVSCLRVSIIADHDRDGKADSKDLIIADRCSSDTPEALFLPAITDTDRRCSKRITNETVTEELDRCHDGTDNILRHPERLAPLITKPVEGLSNEAVGTIRVVCDTEQWKDCENKIRIFFQNHDGEWTYVPANKTFTADQLKTGLILGVDGRDVRRPKVWDGRVRLRFHVRDNKSNEEATDCVAMRVAPLVTHHHLQDAQKVFSFGQTMGYPPYEQMKKDLVEAVQGAWLEEEPIYHFDRYMDIWTQDFFEAAYTSIPGPNDENVGIRVMIRSSVPWVDSGRAVFEELRNGDVGAVQDFQSEPGDFTIDGTGNLEAIPPYTNGDANYPAGRIIMGMFRNDTPAILPLLQSQEVQDPVLLDNFWLEIGHVDEYFQFLPADSERGWVLMAADPSQGIALLQAARKAGHGDRRANSRPPRPYDGENACVPNHTINEVLQMELMLEANRFAHERIEYNIGIIKKETGLTDEEVLRIPSVSYMDIWKCDGEGEPIEDDPEEGEGEGESEGEGDDESSDSGSIQEREKRQQRLRRRRLMRRIAMERNDGHPEIGGRPPGMEWGLSSFYPASINGLVLPGHVITSNPWGPVIDGVDVFAEAIEASYGKVEMNVTFVDDFFSLREGQGGVHCATNSWRDVGDAKWWQ